MSHRVLFVDDEKCVLNGVERRLGVHFDLDTAASGAEALRLMRDRGPYAVVVTDMRMPEMDGVSLVANARPLAPDTVYVMLTGNQDQATCVRAVNEGRVFQFINKPCKSDDLKRAVQASIRQYDVVTGERRRLFNTMVGTVDLLVGLLEDCRPDVHQRSKRIAQIVEHVRGECQLPDRWEVQLAARLSLIGFGVMPREAMGDFAARRLGDPEGERIFNEAAEIARLSVEKIPLLPLVAQMVGGQSQADGDTVAKDAPSEPELARMGASLLRIALGMDCLVEQGVTQYEAARRLQQHLPAMPDNVAAALQTFTLTDEAPSETPAPAG